jgi:hypothetical protein
MSKFWGLLVFLLMLLAIDDGVPWVPWKLIVCFFIIVFGGLAKTARTAERETKQIQRDKEAKEVLESLKAEGSQKAKEP